MKPTSRRVVRLLAVWLAAATLSSCCFHGHHRHGCFGFVAPPHVHVRCR
jgi:hypothetical protein